MVTPSFFFFCEVIYIKRLSCIIFIAFFLVIFSLTCFAGVDDNFTLKELLSYNGADTFAYRFGRGGNLVSADATWSNDNYLNITSSKGTSLVDSIAFGAQVFGYLPSEEDRNPMFVLSSNDVVSFRAQHIGCMFNFDSNNPPSFSNDFTLKIRLYFTDGKLSPGSKYYNSYPVDVLTKTDAVVSKSGTLFGATFYNIAFDVTVPQKYTAIWKIEFEIFSSNASRTYSTFSVFSSNIDFYIGDKAGAPLYDGPDNTNQDLLDSAEGQFRSDSDNAHNQFNGLFGSFKDLFAPNSDFLLGLTWVTAFLNRFISGIPGLNSLLIFSITFGLLLFIIGSVGFVVGKIKSNQSSRVRSDRRSSYKRGSG